jgi:hypothetical protein
LVKSLQRRFVGFHLQCGPMKARFETQRGPTWGGKKKVLAAATFPAGHARTPGDPMGIGNEGTQRAFIPWGMAPAWRHRQPCWTVTCIPGLKADTKIEKIKAKPLRRCEECKRIAVAVTRCPRFETQRAAPECCDGWPGYSGL